jgi:hypothetical protein
VERPEPAPRQPGADLVLQAIPQGAQSLKTGAVSMVFHVPYDYWDKAFEVHKMQGKSVRLEIYVEEEGLG